MKSQPSLNGTNGHPSYSEKPTHEQVAAAAYHLYVEHGRQDGHDLDDWLRAEQLLSRQMAPRIPASPNQSNAMPSVRPVDSREHTVARDERGAATREEIRRQTTQMRPASRQSLRRAERTNQAR